MTYLSGIGERRAAEATGLVRAYYRRAADTGMAEASVLASLAGDAEERLRGLEHEVETADLSSLLDHCGVDRVDLLKINVEGAEEDVLRGIRPGHWPHIRQVCLEVERASDAGPRIEAMLREAGFRVHRIADWTLDAAADVTYVYAVREPDRTDPATPAEAPKDDLLNARELRRYLASRLPSAMTPEQIVFVEDLPRLPNGKVARRDLPPPPQVPPAGEGPDGPGGNRVERLRAIWQRTLAVDGVVDDDDFLALGGHSLTALKVSIQVRRELGVEVPPRDCLRLGTFAAWAAEVLAADPAVADPAVADPAVADPAVADPAVAGA
jgi:acyl carrier protein